MKYLLILTDQDFVGGAEVNYRFMIPEFEKQGYQPVFITPASENLKAYFQQFGIQLQTEDVLETYFSFTINGRVSPLNIARSLNVLRRNRKRVQQLIRKYKPAAIISNSMLAHLMNALLKKDLPFIKLMHLQGIVIRKKLFGLYGKGLDWITSKVDRVVSISDAVTATVSTDYNYKVHRLYNPIPNDLPKYRKKNRSYLKVGMFARYTPWKGHEDLVKIAEACKDENIAFVSYGNVKAEDKGFMESLKKKSKSLPNLFFKGFAHDIYQEMADCDVVLHLSKLPEPFGRILTEANACGTPVFAYKGGAVEELFQNLQLSGEKFDVGDWSGITDALKTFDWNHYRLPVLNSLFPENYTNSFINSFKMA